MFFDIFIKVWYNNVEKQTERSEVRRMADHSGHRQRILRKLKEGGLCEHEILELLLFNAVPRRNTNDLAHRLLSEFGTVYNIFSEPFERLLQVEGVGEQVAAYLYCIGRLYREYDKGKNGLMPCLLNVYQEETFLSYAKKEYSKLSYERLDVYLLDADSRIIGRKSHSVSHAGEVLVDPEFFLELLVNHAPSGIVVVHNHPVGSCTPSEVDDVATKQVLRLCKMHNVLFCEHLVYGLDGVFSYGSSNRLTQLAEDVQKEW